MFSSLLIANRGEIARRIIRTARRMGVRSVAVFTEADRTWPHWREADAAVLIGDGPAGESYLSIERILAAARQERVDAIHPGYGFLSENAAFAEACADAEFVFVGPPASAIRAMGSKSEAKAIMARAGVPVVPGYGGERQEPEFLRQKAYEIGYPLMVKAVSGGGGRGMRRVDRALDFEAALAAAKREAQSAFGDQRVLLERYVERPRHIEVQVFADEQGNAVHLFERDCSVQRRHQKVIEEAPAPGLSEPMRAAMGEAAVKAALAVGYRGAGTVEFVAGTGEDRSPEAFYFIEMNTRLQVEHPVTEAVTGQDLVEWQLRIAAGENLPLRQEDISASGNAMEARIYAEDPSDDFRPSTAALWAASFPSGARVDSGVDQGTIVSPFYDAMLAKIIVTGGDREEARRRLADALDETLIAGPRTNLAFLAAIVAHDDFIAGSVDTAWVDREIAELKGEPPDPGFAARAIAARVAGEADRLAAPAPGPWKRVDAFELGSLRRLTTMDVEVDGERQEAEIAWGGARPTVVRMRGAEIDEAAGAKVVPAGPDLIVVHGGRQTRLAFPDPLARDEEDMLADGAVHIPMPGRVTDVAVQPGSHVRRGDQLFTLEAMKMEHGVLAPVAGTVSELQITAGQQVEQGAVAVVIQPHPEAVD